MNVLILCDRDSESFCGCDLSVMAESAVTEAGGKAKIVQLRGEEINHCIGCFNCWVKTPGICIQTGDSANSFAAQEIQSDAVIFLSKITWGCYSYDIKSFLDRSIPNIMPFFEIAGGDMRHKMRYKKFPYIISIGYGGNSAREKSIFANLTRHNSLNFRPPKHFVFNIDSCGETADAVKAGAAAMESLKKVLKNEVLI